MPDGQTSDQMARWFAHKRQMRAALLSKEWSEQRWRFFLGTIVLSGLLAGLLRAQVIPYTEAALMIYWPAGIVMVIFFAMGSVAAEKSERTWEFLTAQPISRAEILRAKWLMGLMQLVGMMAITTVAGLLAMYSRGFRLMPSTLHMWRADNIADLPKMLSATVGVWSTGHPAIWLCVLAVSATVALTCCYTPLFFILTRARNEFAAALGGILLTIA